MIIEVAGGLLAASGAMSLAGFRRATRERAARTELQRGLATIVRQEALTTGIFVVAMASVVNALERSIRVDGTVDLDSIMPSRMSSGDATLQLVALGSKAATCLVQYNGRIEIASRLTRAARQERRNTGLFLDDVRLLAAQWRSAATFGLAMDYALEDCGGTADSELGDSAVRHRNQLISVIDGRFPFVDENGCVTVPGWIERRREARSLESHPVQVVTDGGRYHAQVRDVSSTGLGLEGEFPANPGDQVLVVFDDGRRFSGTIAWSRGRRKGMRNLSSVHSDHSATS